MKNHFNFRRFGLLLRKHTAENYTSYLMSLVVLVGAMALVMGFAAYVTPKTLDTGLQDLFFGLFLFGAGSVFTSTVFSNLGDHKRAIAFLTLPASSLEKYLVGWIFSFLVFLLIYMPAFYGVAAVVVSMDGRGTEEAQLLSIFGANSNIDKIILMYAFLHAVALVGAVFFRKVHFIKTVFILFVGFFALLILNKQLLQALLGRDNLSGIPFSAVSFAENEQLYTVGVPDTDLSLTWVASIGFILLIWAAAYFKLKEKQV